MSPPTSSLALSSGTSPIRPAVPLEYGNDGTRTAETMAPWPGTQQPDRRQGQKLVKPIADEVHILLASATIDKLCGSVVTRLGDGASEDPGVHWCFDRADLQSQKDTSYPGRLPREDGEVDHVLR